MSADNTEIVVLKTSTDQSYDAFLEDLPEAECRWAVYDFEFDSGEGLRNKILFYMWCVANPSLLSLVVVVGRRRRRRP